MVVGLTVDQLGHHRRFRPWNDVVKDGCLAGTVQKFDYEINLTQKCSIYSPEMPVTTHYYNIFRFGNPPQKTFHFVTGLGDFFPTCLKLHSCSSPGRAVVWVRSSSGNIGLGWSGRGWSGAAHAHGTRRCSVGMLMLNGKAIRVIYFKHIHMGVSENSGFSPQIIHFDRVFHYKPSILGVSPFLETPISKDQAMNIYDHYDHFWVICLLRMHSLGC